MKNPLGLWITDTHLGENTVEINLSIFTQAFDLCEAIGVKQIFHGGDIFNSRRGQSEEVLCTFKQILDEANNRGIKIYAIPGNHDKTDLTKDRSYLDAFDGQPAFKVMKSDDWIQNEHVDIFFLPYYDEQLAYKEKLKQVSLLVSEERKAMLLTHVGISEALTNVGVKVDNELDKSLFKAFDYVLIGHYHDRQILEEDKVIYTGSAYQANFGENPHKGVVVIYDDPVDPLEFITLEFKKYVTVDILPDDLDAELISQINDKGKEANIRLRVAGDIPEAKKNLVATLQSAGTKVQVEKESYSPTDIVQGKKVIMTDGNILSTYDEWTKDRNIKDVKYGKKLLTEAVK